MLHDEGKEIKITTMRCILYSNKSCLIPGLFIIITSLKSNWNTVCNYVYRKVIIIYKTLK